MPRNFFFSHLPDFVDALAYIGLGLALQVGAGPVKPSARVNEEGTFGWMKMEREMAERSVRQTFGAGGF